MWHLVPKHERMLIVHAHAVQQEASLVKSAFTSDGLWGLEAYRLARRQIAFQGGRRIRRHVRICSIAWAAELHVSFFSIKYFSSIVLFLASCCMLSGYSGYTQFMYRNTTVSPTWLVQEDEAQKNEDDMIFFFFFLSAFLLSTYLPVWTPSSLRYASGIYRQQAAQVEQVR